MEIWSIQKKRTELFFLDREGFTQGISLSKDLRKLVNQVWRELEKDVERNMSHIFKEWTAEEVSS